METKKASLHLSWAIFALFLSLMALKASGLLLLDMIWVLSPLWIIGWIGILITILRGSRTE